MSFQTLQMSLPLSTETPRPQGTRRPSAPSLLSRPPIPPSSPQQTPLRPVPSLQTPRNPTCPGHQTPLRPVPSLLAGLIPLLIPSHSSDRLLLPEGLLSLSEIQVLASQVVSILNHHKLPWKSLKVEQQILSSQQMGRRFLLILCNRLGFPSGSE